MRCLEAGCRWRRDGQKRPPDEGDRDSAIAPALVEGRGHALPSTDMDALSRSCRIAIANLAPGL